MQFDENGMAMLYVFENCKAFIRTMPLLQYSQTAPEDLDTAQEDHVADEVRYMCMSRPIKPRVPAERDPFLADPARVALDLRKEDLAQPVRRPRMQIIRGENDA